MTVSNPFDIVAAPPLPGLMSVQVRAYHPMAGVIEVVVGAPRKWGANGSVPASSLPLVYTQGESPVLDFLTGGPGERVCGLDRCLFDSRVQFDPLAGPDAALPVGDTWNDVLQAQIDALRPPIASLYALKADAVRFGAFVRDFQAGYLARAEATRVLSMVSHPQTGSLWALRRNKLVEISKTGTLLRSTADPSKCVPSGVGLCNPCMWAVVGGACRPCAGADAPPGVESGALAQRAHRVSCPPTLACAAVAAPNGTRRLLVVLANAAPEVLIAFALVGDRATIVALWPNASAVDASSGLVRVSVFTTTPVETMRSIKARLLELPELRVVVPPHVVITLEATAAEGTTPIGMILGIVLGSLCLVAIVVCLCVCVLREGVRGAAAPSRGPAYAPLPRTDVYNN